MKFLAPMSTLTNFSAHMCQPWHISAIVHTIECVCSCTLHIAQVKECKDIKNT